MTEKHEVHHHQMRKWLIVMLIAFVVLLAMALNIQKPDALTGVPFLGPTVTPTPVASENIILTEPVEDQNISQRFVVKGKARGSENTVYIRIREKLSGNVIGETTAITDASEPGQFGEFGTGIQLADPTIRSGSKFVLEVFLYSAIDGKETDKVSIPLTFTPVAE